MSSPSPDSLPSPSVELRFTLFRNEYLRTARDATLAAAWFRISVALGVGVLAAGVVKHWPVAVAWGLLYTLAIAATLVAYPVRV